MARRKYPQVWVRLNAPGVDTWIIISSRIALAWQEGQHIYTHHQQQAVKGLMETIERMPVWVRCEADA